MFDSNKMTIINGSPIGEDGGLGSRAKLRLRRLPSWRENNILAAGQFRVKDPRNKVDVKKWYFFYEI